MLVSSALNTVKPHIDNMNVLISLIYLIMDYLTNITKFVKFSLTCSSDIIWSNTGASIRGRF